MNKDADQARRDEQLSVDKYVLLSTKSLRLFHVDRQKMLSKYLGPFVVQSGRDYLNELDNRGRQAARVGKPDSAAARGDNTISVSGNINTDSQDAVAAESKRGRGRPRKTGITKPAQNKAAELLCSFCC
ncbi:TPA: hypothetical protein ACH3X2_001382 [Trebouxia sp. C0005]